MIIPEIMPGELGMGYLLRFRDINGYRSVDDAIGELRARVGGMAGPNKSQVALLLASALGMSSEQFCRYHTLLPIIRAVTSYLADVSHGDPAHAGILRSHGSGLVYKEIKSCFSCVQEDIDYWGFAYFRRDHQLPGVTLCSKHQEILNLSKINDQVTPDKVQPSDNINCMVEAMSSSQQEVITRYLMIVESWSMAERPIPVLQLVCVLQDRARKLGLRWSKMGKKQLFSDLVLEVCPGSWLSALIPKIENKEKGRYFASLDGLLTPRERSFRSTSYALALSILYDDAQEALNAAYACLAAEPRSISSAIRMGEGFWTGHRFIKNYTEHRGNPNAIAKAMDLNIRHTRDMMSKNGLPSLNKYGKAELQALVDFQEGLTLEEACNKSKVNQRTLEQLLRSASCKLTEAVRSFKETDRTGIRANVESQNANAVVTITEHDDSTISSTHTAFISSNLSCPKVRQEILRPTNEVFVVRHQLRHPGAERLSGRSDGA